MANPLHFLGWDVHIIMEDTTENKHRVNLECNSHIHIHYFSATSAIQEIHLKNRIIKDISPSYVYLCAFVFRNIIMVPKNCKIITEHSELQSKMNNLGIKRIRFYFLEYFSIIYSNGILNASKYLEKVYIKRMKYLRIKKPTLYFPYAYHKSICSTINTNIKKTNEKYFLYIGSIVTNYGCFTMIHAFEKIKKIDQSLKLLLIGDGENYKEVISYIQEHQLEDTIHVSGYIKEEDIAAYFSTADAFLSPMNNTIQDWARCPSKMYMYLPYQKPIITCRIGEPYEILKEKGTYYEPSNVDSLANTIIHFVKQNNWTLNIDPSKHEWGNRTIDFHNWINHCF